MLIIQNGTLVSPDGQTRADLRVSGGIIDAAAPRIDPAPGDEVLDARGCLVFPGFIDAHTHCDLDHGVTVTADDFETGTAAALAGGTTAIIDFATQDKGCTLKDALAVWRQKADGRSSCHYGFHMAITDWNDGARAELSDMMAAGVTSFKLYMAYDALRVDDAQILDILGEMKRIQGLVGVHCENGTLVNALSAKLRAQGRLSPAAHPLSRPAELEAEAVSRLLYIARLADWPVAVVHLSSALGLAEVRKARAMGQRVLVETCPQYLLLNDSVYGQPDFEGAKYVCSPPLRKPSDQAALIEALAGGEIDTVATDHCSYRFDGQKTLGGNDFTKIPNGMPGVEHRPAVIYSALVDKGLLTPEAMCRLLSTGPAKAYGLYPQKGALTPGSDADIVIWEKHIAPITAAAQLQNTDYTPYEGFMTTGRARAVLLGGEIAAQAGNVTRRHLGQYLRRGKSAVVTE